MSYGATPSDTHARLDRQHNAISTENREIAEAIFKSKDWHAGSAGARFGKNELGTKCRNIASITSDQMENLKGSEPSTAMTTRRQSHTGWKRRRDLVRPS
jgi:L-rhamnose isomerase